MRDVYAPTHWSLTGTPPAWDTPDEDVYLVGRNIVLLGKAAVYCALRKIERIALGPLAGNPFPDATTEFYEAMARALSLGLAHPMAIETPYRTWHKPDVIRRGHAIGAPMALTLSCMNPVEGLHCGACSKCRERHDAFIEALGHDPTTYAAAGPAESRDKGQRRSHKGVKGRGRSVPRLDGRHDDADQGPDSPSSTVRGARWSATGAGWAPWGVREVPGGRGCSCASG